MFNCVFKPRFSKCFKYFFITDSHTLHQNIRDFWITDFLWHSKQHTQHLIWCKWCNYHFLNVLHFEHNDILFSDFGSWISLVELNLGTNQLSRLPGMLSWVYDYITSTYGKNHWTTVFIWVYRSLELLWVYLTSLCGEHCFKKLANLQPSFEMFSIKFDWLNSSLLSRGIPCCQ